MSRNRMANALNPYQGQSKKVLCVCSAGLLRSPTAAWVLSNPPFNFNTRAVGTDKEFALIPLDEVLIHWADEIVCMNDDQRNIIIDLMPNKKVLEHKKIHVIDVPDSFDFKDEVLVKIMTDKLIKEFNI